MNIKDILFFELSCIFLHYRYGNSYEYVGITSQYIIFIPVPRGAFAPVLNVCTESKYNQIYYLYLKD